MTTEKSKYEEQIRAYLLNEELTEDERCALREHLQSSEHCQSLVAHWEMVDEDLADLKESEKSNSQFVSSVMDKIHEQSAPQSASLVERIVDFFEAWGSQFAGMTAAVLLLVFQFPYLLQEYQPSDSNLSRSYAQILDSQDEIGQLLNETSSDAYYSFIVGEVSYE